MDFYERAIHYLKNEFPKQTVKLTDTDLHASIREGIMRANVYQLVSEIDVMRFIDLQWRIDKNFDLSPDYPWARKILSDKDTSPENKINLLSDAYTVYRASITGQANR